MIILLEVTSTYYSFMKNVQVLKEMAHIDERDRNKTFSSHKITMLHMLKTQY